MRIALLSVGLFTGLVFGCVTSPSPNQNQPANLREAAPRIHAGTGARLQDLCGQEPPFFRQVQPESGPAYWQSRTTICDLRLYPGVHTPLLKFTQPWLRRHQVSVFNSTGKMTMVAVYQDKLPPDNPCEVTLRHTYALTDRGSFSFFYSVRPPDKMFCPNRPKSDQREEKRPNIPPPADNYQEKSLGLAEEIIKILFTR